ncbi:MAG: phage tail tape measure protein [Neisseria sp.]|mgnify:FL=1|nr:phage tail tape measure protein [Neisseria sp.]
MSTSQQIMIKITADSRGVTMAFKKAEQETDSFSGKLRRAARNSYFGRLRDDLKKVRQEARQAWQQMSTLEKTTHRMQRVGSLAAGVTAAAWVLKEPVKKTMDFDMRMRHMSNTAYAGESLDRRRVGVKELEAAINSAVRSYGGNRDSAAGALDSIIASGVLQPDAAMRMLPAIQKAATGFNAETEDIAAIGIAAVQNMKVNADEIGKVLDMAGKGGQEGGFELNNMARWLPEQLAGAGNAGMSGQKGIARVIAMNQLARTTAGSADQAGNNVSNLIGKLKSSDTLTAFNKKFDIDLTDRYKKGMLEGKDTMEVFADTLTEIVGKDKKFAQAVKMAEKAKAEGDKSAATWEQISSVMEGSVVGQVIRDKEAGMALTAYMSNRELGQEIYQKVLDAQGVVDDNFQLVQEGSGYKTQQGQNEKDIKTQEAFEPFNNLLGVAAEKLVEFSQAFPQLSTWLTGAGYTGMALGAAGIGGGVFMKATGMSLPFFGGAGAGTGAGAAAGTGTSGWLTGMLSKLFSSRVLGSVGLLLHSESLNEGEYERILEMRRKQAEANGVDAKRQALGIGPELAKQAGDAITQSGHAMLVQTQAVGQALITQVGATKIEGNINVNVSAAPGLNVWTSSVGNGNTQLNVGKTNTAAK